MVARVADQQFHSNLILHLTLKNVNVQVGIEIACCRILFDILTVYFGNANTYWLN